MRSPNRSDRGPRGPVQQQRATRDRPRCTPAPLWVRVYTDVQWTSRLAPRRPPATARAIPQHHTKEVATSVSTCSEQHRGVGRGAPERMAVVDGSTTYGRNCYITFFFFFLVWYNSISGLFPGSQMCISPLAGFAPSAKLKTAHHHSLLASRSRHDGTSDDVLHGRECEPSSHGPFPAFVC